MENISAQFALGLSEVQVCIPFCLYLPKQYSFIFRVTKLVSQFLVPRLLACRNKHMANKNGNLIVASEYSWMDFPKGVY